MMGEPVTNAPVVTDEEGPRFRQFAPFLQRVGVDRRSWRTAGILIPFLVLFVVLSVSSGPFLTKGNLLNILDQQSATLIMAAAGTLVLVGGGIDLSVGANYALSGVVAK
jgi:ribose transport system permease protein